MSIEMNLTWTSFDSIQAYQRWLSSVGEVLRVRSGLESATLDAWHAMGSPDGYLLPGLCPVCEVPSTFAIDRSFGGSFQASVGHVPNWRERLVCNKCGLNARVRASVALIHEMIENRESGIWLSEQVTPLFARLSAEYPRLIGSEYLGADFASGTVNESGVRHEDSCNSSFGESSLDGSISFDVLEHIPDYAAALRETARILRPGGKFIWTAPFDIGRYETQVRARVNSDGSIVHLAEPDYHGDPVNPDQGILCYQYFGWGVLDEMRTAGFADAWVYQTWSMTHGLLGPAQSIFVARR